MFKKKIKQIFTCLFLFASYPFFLLYFCISGLFDRDGVFWAFSQYISLFPGKSGAYFRKAFYHFSMTRCSLETSIMFATIFSHSDTEIGNSVYIGPQCNIGMCRIDDFCTLGSGVHILSGKNQHVFEDIETPVRDQGGVFEKIVIGEDTWIGNGAIIMANIGKKCIIGAGSVVTKDIDDFCIAVGNPAKVIRKRGEQNFNL